MNRFSHPFRAGKELLVRLLRHLPPVGIRGASNLRVCHAELNGFHWLLLKNDAISQHLLRGEPWEPHFVRFVEGVLHPGDVAVDLGANFGFHTVVMASLVGTNGEVHAFEPLRIVFQQLCANVFLNGLANVHTYNVAAADVDDKVIAMNPVDWGAQWVNIGDTSVGSGGDSVLTKTVDSLRLKEVALIKLDIQGYELPALKGAAQTLSRCRPYLFVEIEEPHLRKVGYDSKTLIEHLFAAGYFLVRIKNAYPCDHVAVPVERESELPELLKHVDYPVDILKGKHISLYFDGPHRDVIYHRFRTYG